MHKTFGLHVYFFSSLFEACLIFPLHTHAVKLNAIRQFVPSLKYCTREGMELHIVPYRAVRSVANLDVQLYIVQCKMSIFSMRSFIQCRPTYSNATYSRALYFVHFIYIPQAGRHCMQIKALIN